MKIALIYVMYGETQKQIDAFKSHNLANYKVYPVDNTKNNRGYAGGVNEGIKQGLREGADLFIIANTDISFQKLSKKTITDPAKELDVWGYAFRQGKQTFYGGVIDRWRLSASLNDTKPRARFAEVPFVSGSFMVIKRTVVEKIGLWEEDYFLYYEDVDYCVRAKEAGFRVGVDSDIEYVHFERSNKQPERKRYYLAMSRLKFFLRFSTPRQKLRELLRLPITLKEEFHVLTYALLNNPFLINFISLNLSSLFGKFLNFLLFLVLIRSVSVGQYGIYTLVWAQVGLFAPLVDFGTTSYGIVHLGAAEGKKINNLFSLRFFLAVIVFLLTLGVSLFFRFPPALVLFIFLTSFTIFSNMFSGSYLILTSLRQKLYAASSLATVFNVITVVSLMLAVFLTGRIEPVFFIIFVCYTIYAVVNAIRIRQELPDFRLRFIPHEWFQIVKKSYVFVLISFFASLYFKIDVFLLQFLKGEAAVGVYSAGYKFLEALILIAASYNVAATPILSSLYKKGVDKMKMRMKKDLLFLSAIGLLVSVAIYLTAPLLLPFLLKGSYAESIKVLRIVVFALPLILLSSIFLNALYVMNKAFVVVAIFMMQAVVNFILNIFFIPRYSFLASSYVTVISEILNLLFLSIYFVFLTRKFTRVHEHIS